VKKDGSTFILSMAIFAAMLGVGIIVPLLPLYANRLGATAFEIGMIFSGFSIARMIFMPVVGRLSDKHGRKPFLTAGLILYSFSSVGYIAAKTVLALGLVRFAHGFAAAMVIPVAFAYIGDLAPVNEEGRYVGIFQTALFLGFGFGPLLGGVISDIFNMKANFLALGALAGLAALMVFFGLGESAPKRRTPHPPILSSLKIPVVSGLMIYRFVTALGRGTLMAFLPLFADKVGHLTTSQIGLIISSNMLFSASLQSSGGRLADKSSRVGLVLGGSVISSLILCILPLGRSFWPLLGLNLLLGISSAISLPAASAIAIDEGRKAGMGQLFGLFNVAMSAGIATGPLVAGGIARAINLQAVFPFAGIFTLLGGFAFYALANRSQSISAASNTGPS